MLKPGLRTLPQTQSRSEENGPHLVSVCFQDCSFADCLPATKRQSVAPVASLNDGSQGVDSEDIINIPQIGFGTFQLFPDQNTYGPEDPNLPAFNNTVENGIDWIKQQAAVSQLYVDSLYVRDKEWLIRYKLWKTHYSYRFWSSHTSECALFRAVQHLHCAVRPWNTEQ